MPGEKLLDFIERIKDIPHLEIYTSNEAVSGAAEYIRDGLDYNQWMQNTQELLSHDSVKAMHFMCTINALCLTTLPNFLSQLMGLKQTYGRDRVIFTLNILRFPSFQSPLILPDNLRTQFKNNLQAWLDTHRDHPLMHEHEINHLQRLIDYLDVIKTPHRNTADQDKLYNDFKNFYLQYDVRRGKHFRSTFPQEFVDFIDSIDVPVPSKEEILNQQYRDEVGSVGEMEGDPATTEGGYISDEVAHGWNTKTDELGANEQ